MALALVRSLHTDGDGVVVEIDTGTNPLYQVMLGRGVRDDDGFTVLDDVYWSSPWLRNSQAGRHLDTRVRHVLEAGVVQPRSLLQVVSCKEGGRAAARSSPRRLSAHLDLPRPDDVPELAMSASSARPNGTIVLAAPRMVGVLSARETFTRPASLDDLLGSLVQAAVPVVQQLLQPTGSGAPAGTTTGASGAASAAPTGNDQLGALLASLLRSFLGSVAGGAALAAPSSVRDGNRLTQDLARPFLFGVDDALLAALAGPILSSIAGPLVQALPELLNSTNQHRLDSRREDYRMIGELLQGLDRGQLIDRLATTGAPGTTPAASDGADLAALIQLLRTATAPTGTGSPAPATAAPPPLAATPGPTAPAPSRPASLAASGAPTAAASGALLSLVAGPAVAWLGKPQLVFVRDQSLVLRFRWDTGSHAPAAPLPRAVLTLVVREPGGRDVLTREERVTDLQPGGEVRMALDPADLAAIPSDTEVELFARLRWPGGHAVRQATCVQRLVFGGGRHVAGPGVPTGEPVRLADMARFRPFWNKVWSSPAPTDDQPLWGVDLTLRYSVVLTATESANGLMEARSNQGPSGDGLRATASGRLKSGLQVSVHELNQLAPLWPGTQPLDPATLSAFTAPGWVATQGGDAELQVRFDGRRHTRGLLWVVPEPRLRTFPVARPSEVDGFGQVVATTTAQVAFPVIEELRILGLASTGGAAGDETATDPGSEYAFVGYDVVRDVKVGLEPAAARPQPAPTTPVGELEGSAR